MDPVEPLPAADPARRPRLDTGVFVPSLVLTLAAALWLVLVPDTAERQASLAMGLVTGRFGWLFAVTAVAALGFCAWLAFGRYGRVKLGLPGDAPEYSELSWAAMMFSAGIGIGLVSWAFVEPIHYLATPPLGLPTDTTEAAEWAHMYALFHWGFVPWAIYAVPTVPVAYALYVRERPFLRVSTACEGALPRAVRPVAEPVIDTLVILGIVGGAGTSLGLGVPLVSAFAGALTGVEPGIGLQLGVLAVWTLLFSTSVYRGLSEGIRWLADCNIVLAVVVVAFVLLAGPTVFVMELSANSLGLMLDHFVRMTFWLDPIDKGGFPETWTLFYWAWWIAYAPLMGLFFGRISRGRTIRRTVLGVIGWGSLGCMSFMAVCSGYALHLELEGLLPVGEIVARDGNPAAVVAILGTLPAPGLVLLVVTVLATVFLATTLDSVAYVLASITMRDLPGHVEPPRPNRLVWAFALALVAVGLLAVGALSTVQSASIVTALPLIPVLVLIAASLRRWLAEDFDAVLTRPVVALVVDRDGARKVVEIDPPGPDEHVVAREPAPRNRRRDDPLPATGPGTGAR